MNNTAIPLANSITVIKCDYKGKETWRYQGQLIKRGLHFIRLEAYFDLPTVILHGMELCKGDRFLETYYDNRWYNIYKIYDHQDGHFKGWYCNIGYPATFENQTITYRDLALDLIIFPDGYQIVLDEDEFSTLPLSERERRKALFVLGKLQTSFSKLKGF